MQKTRPAHPTRVRKPLDLQRSDVICCLLALAATVVHFYVVITYSINLPFSDDFDQQFARLRNYQTGVWSVWQFLFEQHNEHRITTTHLLSLASYLMLGEVNIKFQIIASSAVLVILVLALASLAKDEYRLKILAVAACFILLPNASNVWLGGGVQYYTVVLFGTLSLIFLRNLHRPTYLFASILCFYLAMFSMASGIVMIIPAAIMLMAERKASLSTKLLWVSLAALCLVLFFNGYQTSNDKPSIFYAFTSPVFAIQYFLLILGGPFFGIELGRVIQLASALLIAVLVVQFARLKPKARVFHETSFYVAVYLIGVVALVVAGRVGFEEWETALSARYQIYVKSFWVVALVLLINLKLFSSRLLSVLAACAAMYFCLGAVKSERVLKYNQQHLSVGISEFVFGQNHAHIEYGSVNGKTLAANTMKTLMTMHLYHPTFVTSKPAVWKTPLDVEINPSIKLTDLRFNQYRRFTVSGKFNQALIVQLSGVDDLGFEASYSAKRIRGLDKYEVLVDESVVNVPESVWVNVVDDGVLVAELISDQSVRLAGSMVGF